MLIFFNTQHKIRHFISVVLFQDSQAIAFSSRQKLSQKLPRKYEKTRQYTFIVFCSKIKIQNVFKVKAFNTGQKAPSILCQNCPKGMIKPKEFEEKRKKASQKFSETVQESHKYTEGLHKDFMKFQHSIQHNTFEKCNQKNIFLKVTN